MTPFADSQVGQTDVGFVTIGQRLSLQADTEYEATVWVRWANPSSGPPSNAIVSFWIRDRDGKGVVSKNSSPLLVDARQQFVIGQRAVF